MVIPPPRINASSTPRPQRADVPTPSPEPLRAGRGLFMGLRRVAARMLSHETPRVMCPPGPVPMGDLPPIVICSLMRSGTHLLIDLLLNNLREYRREPLYIDFDQYVFSGHDRETLRRAGNCLIKSHAAQRPFDDSVRDLLRELAGGLVVIPQRPREQIRASLSRWNQALARDAEEKQEELWEGMNPLRIDFRALLDPVSAGKFLQTVRERLGLNPSSAPPMMPAAATSGVLWDKLQTRLRGSRARRVNTTIGYRLGGHGL